MDKHRFLIFFLFAFTSFHIVFSQDSGIKPEDQVDKLFAFGIIADVQYADVEKAAKRDYRNSLDKLDRSINSVIKVEHLRNKK